MRDPISWSKEKYSADDFLAPFPQWHYPTGAAEAQCYNPACRHSGIQIENSSAFSTRGLELSKSLTGSSQLTALKLWKIPATDRKPPPHSPWCISGRIIDKDSLSGMTLIASPKPFKKWFACHFNRCYTLYDAHVSRKATRLLMQKKWGGIGLEKSLSLSALNIKCNQYFHYKTN